MPKNYDHVNDLLSGGRRTSNRWKPVDGGYSDVRILPSNPIMASAFRHWNIIDKRLVKCLGQQCPFCAVSKALKKKSEGFSKDSQHQKALAAAANRIKCSYNVAYNVLVPQQDGSHVVRAWITTGGNQKTIATLIEEEKREDPEFDPTQYDLSIKYDSKAPGTHMYSLKFKTRGGPSDIALPDWEKHVLDLEAELTDNVVEMTQEQAIEHMSGEYDKVLQKFGLPTVAGLVGGEGGSALEGVTPTELMALSSEAVDTSTPATTEDSKPSGQGQSKAADMLNKLDG